MVNEKKSWAFRPRLPSRRAQIIIAAGLLLFVLSFVLAPQAWGDLGGVLAGFVPNAVIETAGNLEKAGSVFKAAFVAHWPTR